MSHLWQMKTWQKLGDKRKSFPQPPSERAGEWESHLIIFNFLWQIPFHFDRDRLNDRRRRLRYRKSIIELSVCHSSRRRGKSKQKKVGWENLRKMKKRWNELWLGKVLDRKKNEFKEDNEECQEVRHLSSWHHWWCCKLVMGLFLLPIWKVNSAAGWAAMASVGWPKRQIRRLRFT